MAEVIGDIDMETVDQSTEEEKMDQKIINEEYKTWKKNSPFLYDMILSTALEWPTLTTQWFPDKKELPGKNYSIHRLLLGTHTSNDAPNYLQIAHVEIPNNATPNPNNYDEQRGEIGGYGNGSSGEQAAVKLTIEQKIDHPGEINKARYQPQNPNIIATMCPDKRVLIFDRTKHSSTPSGTVNPQVTLVGHTEEGWGLSWDPHKEGWLATGSNDKTVKLWDLNTVKEHKQKITASATYTYHTGAVNDVQYHPRHKSILGSVSDDLTLQIVDTRKETRDVAAIMNERAHDLPVRSLAFAPGSEFILATGSEDHTIGIWDMRNMTTKMHTLTGHTGTVVTLDWHPTETAILGSAAQDRRIIFWDLSRIGIEQLPEDAEDGPPELLFMHGGHTNFLSDFSWNPNEPWVVCSAAEDNLVQVWKVSEAIVGKDIDDVRVDEVEQ